MGCAPGTRSKNIKVSSVVENDKKESNKVGADDEVEELAPPKIGKIKTGNETEIATKPKTPPKPEEEKPSYEPLLMEKVSFPNYEPKFDFQFLEEEEKPQQPETVKKEDINDLLREINS